MAELADTLEQMPEDIEDKQRLLRTQLALILRLLPKLRAAADEVIRGPVSEPSTSGASAAPA